MRALTDSFLAPVANKRQFQEPGLTCVLGIADRQRAFLNLFLKQVFLVQEENDGCVCKPFVVTNAVKQFHTLMHPVLEKAKEKGGDVSFQSH